MYEEYRVFSYPAVARLPRFAEFKFSVGSRQAWEIRGIVLLAVNIPDVRKHSKSDTWANDRNFDFARF